MNRWRGFLFILLAAFFLSACATGNEEEQETGNQDQTATESESGDEEAHEANDTSEEEVLVSLVNSEGEMVATATLTEGEAGVDIRLEGENLPSGTKGFHIHEEGKCETPDFESAGGHYNPTNAEHGFEHPDGPHAGDLSNIEVAEDGTVEEEVTAEMITLEKNGENTVYTDEGTALVIHSEEDDYNSQPSGDAGDRIACGVIGE
ncbi:superoxide dismutase family protein [Oceanobacillus damuensis]|uniref:superoxide dismutase family protein n=1 Tax=Oceanobacillus damuensis TaxID=937928 RepID=UPI00082EA7E0|nr:superoxide dismutase family protein [Oceanobacillus damuensis]